MPLLIVQLTYSELAFWTFIAIMVLILKARVSWIYSPYKEHEPKKDTIEKYHLTQTLVIYAFIFSVICLTLGLHIYINSTLPNLPDPNDAPMCSIGR